jgi:hypothetical protein
VLASGEALPAVFLRKSSAIVPRVIKAKVSEVGARSAMAPGIPGSQSG